MMGRSAAAAAALLLYSSLTGPLPAADTARPTPLKPPPLRPGDAVALVAPASPAPLGELEEAAANLKRLGYQVKISASASDRRGYLAGTDAARAAAINQAFADPQVRLILCARGGYGSPRILDLIDYDAIRKSPKAIAGYSDITALLTAINERTGLVTFHGPMAGRDFSGRGGLSPFAERHFLGVLAPGDTRSRGVAFEDWGREASGDGEPRVTIVPGVAEGVLRGGNLSCLTALIGTPFEVNTRDAILFLEDVNEEPFRIDRMLNQLRLAGKLGEVRGILLGGFTRCVARTPRESLSLNEVFAQYFSGLRVPVLGGFPAGHLPEQATLPIGTRVRLDATSRTLALLEPAVAEPERKDGDARPEPASPPR